MYQLAIEAAGRDSNIMENYLPVYLSLSARTWLLGLPSGSVRSWTHLCQLFISKFRDMCTCLGVDRDIASIVQKKGESLLEFIQCFYKKRNIILEVDNKSMIMFFKKGLRDSSLIHKLTMKNPKTSEEMLAVANKYAPEQEATYDNK
jgi:hypothetical protein